MPVDVAAAPRLQSRRSSADCVAAYVPDLVAYACVATVLPEVMSNLLEKRDAYNKPRTIRSMHIKRWRIPDMSAIALPR